MALYRATSAARSPAWSPCAGDSPANPSTRLATSRTARQQRGGERPLAAGPVRLGRTPGAWLGRTCGGHERKPRPLRRRDEGSGSGCPARAVSACGCARCAGAGVRAVEEQHRRRGRAGCDGPQGPVEATTPLPACGITQPGRAAEGPGRQRAFEQRGLTAVPKEALAGEQPGTGAGGWAVYTRRAAFGHVTRLGRSSPTKMRHCASAIGCPWSERTRVSSRALKPPPPRMSFITSSL